MTETVDHIVDHILALEGGWVDHPEDRGGPTRYGITSGTLAAWRGRPVGADEVRSLDVEEARAIYRELFVRRPGFDRLPPVLATVVAEAGVLHGPKRAARWLQRALGVKDDGIVGPVTLAAARRAPRARTVARFTSWRVRAIGKLVRHDRSQLVFLGGWLRRATEPLMWDLFGECP